MKGKVGQGACKVEVRNNIIIPNGGWWAPLLACDEGVEGGQLAIRGTADYRCGLVTHGPEDDDGLQG